MEPDDGISLAAHRGLLRLVAGISGKAVALHRVALERQSAPRQADTAPAGGRIRCEIKFFLRPESRPAKTDTGVPSRAPL